MACCKLKAIPHRAREQLTSRAGQGYCAREKLQSSSDHPLLLHLQEAVFSSLLKMGGRLLLPARHGDEMMSVIQLGSGFPPPTTAGAEVSALNFDEGAQCDASLRDRLMCKQMCHLATCSIAAKPFSAARSTQVAPAHRVSCYHVHPPPLPSSKCVTPRRGSLRDLLCSHHPIIEAVLRRQVQIVRIRRTEDYTLFRDVQRCAWIHPRGTHNMINSKPTVVAQMLRADDSLKGKTTRTTSEGCSLSRSRSVK